MGENARMMRKDDATSGEAAEVVRRPQVSNRLFDIGAGGDVAGGWTIRMPLRSEIARKYTPDDGK